ncbi:MAG TPA: putative glycoside hydrolase [Terriglobales bacterium]|nr:putative glycoside hydrolase [Terriglobales bacterium]
MANLLLLSLLLASLCGCGFTRAQTTAQNGSTAQAQPATAPVAVASTQPAAFHYTVKRGESIPAVVREYISHTSYMTGAELESALREVNNKPNGNNLKPGEDLIIPGYESEPIVEHSVPVPKDFEVRAIYLTGTMAGSDHGIRIIRRWHELGGNAVVFDIKDSDGSINIPFDYPLAPKSKHHSIANLPKLIRFLHSENMHAIARIALFRDEHIARTYPELAVQSKRALAAVAQNKVARDKAPAKVPENMAAANQAAQNQVMQNQAAQDGAGAQQNPVAQSNVQNEVQNNDAQNQAAQSKITQSKTAPQPWRENGKLVWTDTSNLKVQDYNLALAKFVAASGADEIQFDYVRFPAEGDQKDAQFAFMKSHPEWQRADVIADFLSRAYSELHPSGVLLSLDVFGVMAWQRSVDLNHTGQDITRMAKFCDVLSPMIYPSHFFGMDGYKRPGDAPEHFISASMQRFEKVTQGSGVVLRPWLQAFAWRTPTYSPQYIETQVKVAKNNGGVGFLFWNARNDYGRPFAAMPEMTHKVDEYFKTVAAKKS